MMMSSLILLLLLLNDAGAGVCGGCSGSVDVVKVAVCGS